ncbi:MAG TPA: DUF6463 family protein [Beutenbergiaceae bacterium]|nr:DUF6463 family protein [Beutenbergiaceae bacterium]
MNQKPSHRSTVIAGWSMVAIAVLHTLAHMFHPYWRQWLTGGLWTGEAGLESISFFWALPGSFVVVLAVLGLLVAGMGRRGDDVPAYVGWGLGLWVLGCLALIGPSGFMFGILPSILLIAADLRRRSARRAGSPMPVTSGEDQATQTR